MESIYKQCLNCGSHMNAVIEICPKCGASAFIYESKEKEEE